MKLFKKIATAVLSVLSLCSLALGVSSLNAYTAEASDGTAANRYVIPINGYYEEDSTHVKPSADGLSSSPRTADDSGVSIWLTTSDGLGGEGNIAGQQWMGLGDIWIDSSHAGWSYMHDYILINGKTFTEANDEGAGLARFVSGYYGNGSLCVRIHTDGRWKVTNGIITEVTIKKGFRLPNSDGTPLGAGTPSDYTMSIVKLDGRYMAVRKASSVTIATNPNVTKYGVTDTFDKTGLSFNVTYVDGGSEVISAKAEMIGEYSFANDAGATVDIPCYVNGLTVNVPVSVGVATVDTSNLDGVVLSGTKSTYALGEAVTGLKFNNVPFTDGSTKSIDVPDRCVFVPTNLSGGPYTGEVSYLGIRKTFTYMVERNESSVVLSIDASGSSYLLSDADDRLGFRFSAQNLPMELKALEFIDRYNYGGYRLSDYIEVNGISLTQAIAEYKIRNLNIIGAAICFGFYEVEEDDTYGLVPETELDETTKLPKNAWKKSDIRSIKLLRGFNLITADKNYWGADEGGADTSISVETLITRPTTGVYKLVPGAALQEDVFLVAYPATNTITRWVRPAAYQGTIEDLENTDGKKGTLNAILNNLESGALTLVTGKTTYNIGDTFDATGYTLNIQYEDGGSGVETFSSASVRGFDSSADATLTCSFKFNTTNTIEFQVIIGNGGSNQDSVGTGDSGFDWGDNSDPGFDWGDGDSSNNSSNVGNSSNETNSSTITTGGCGSVLGSTAICVTLALCGVAMFVKKKEE